MDTNAIPDLWSRLEAWLNINNPEFLELLKPGATEAEIVQVESALGIQFPEDFKAAYRIHDGQSDYSAGLVDGRELLSLERIVDEWKVWKDLLDGGDFDGINSEPGAGIRDDWWNPRWIPVTYDGSGNHDCLDLDPAEGGHTGQIIDFWHDDGSRIVKAPSFASWFAAFVEGCETGQYVYSDEYGGIVNVDDI